MNLKIFKNLVFMGAISASAIIINSCSSDVAYLDNTKSKELTSVGIDYHDIESAAHKSVQSLLSSKYVLGINKAKVLAISDVVNDTMQTLNVQTLTNSISSAMRKSGKFKVTAAISGSGGVKDNMIEKSRNARNNEEFNQYTTIEKGNLIAPELSLSGTIVQKNAKVGKKQRIDYTFILVLTNLKTGIIEWSEETHIIKVAKNSQVAW